MNRGSASLETELLIPGLTSDDERLFQVFHPAAHAKLCNAIKTGGRFVHYTSADTAMKIISGQEVWMRKSSCQNDFREIEHGLECLNSAYMNQKDELVNLLDGMFSGSCAKLEFYFNGWLREFRTQTYLTCVSEHGAEKSLGDDDVRDEEDRLGRLSMWRAYGGKCGVAIVMNSGPFTRPSHALRAYTSPVAYLSTTQFEVEFKGWIDGIRANRDWLQELGEEAFFA